MKPVLQTIFAPPNGNCLQACIASILELPLEEVPNFMQYPNQWLPRYEHFLRARNLQPVYLRFENGQTPDFEPWGYHLITVKSPRGPYDHSLVGFQGKPVHDPFPGGNCAGEVIGWELLISVAPQFGSVRNLLEICARGE
ncbi:MAG: hypothetical protein GYA48_02615 [Chloroflexi bacterium]|nr:hypothetical protein [Chloroflexota bacterium]